DSWWRETIKLFVAQSDGTEIIKRCVRDGVQDVDTLTLALECLDESLTVDPVVSEQARREILEGLESDDPERSRLAAKVIFSIRTRNMVRLNETTQIDTAYISCAEYQAFLDAQGISGGHFEPDHWKVHRFLKGESLRPVAGVRCSDAVAFCE